MTASRSDLPKYARVAAAVREQIADGTLRPGEAAPSGAALSRDTGYSTLTCRRALRILIADGVLVPGTSQNGRPRVAGAPQPRSERDLADAAQALSGGLAARRHAARLTQPGLAALAGVSVTTVGHAETGRVWQSRRFWERADEALDAHGDLIALHDAYRAASAASAASVAASRDRVGVAPASPAGDAGAPAMAAPAMAASVMAASVMAGEPAAAAGCMQAPAGPSYVIVVWEDGTVTTVHPPGVAAPRAERQGELSRPARRGTSAARGRQ